MGSTGDLPASIAGYRVVAELGAGGMGTVYLVRHPRIGRLEALKVVSPQLSADPEFRARFLREADLAASVEAPGIVPVYDRDEVEGQLYLTMRWIDGTDLAQLLRASPRPPVGHVLTGLAGVAGALDAVHRAGLVHRDVKPANVLIARGRFEPPPGGEVQWFLTDFGIARRIDQTTDLTGRAFLGTVPYTAPERFDGAAATPASDIYAFTCLVHEVLLGHPPFGRTAGQVLGAHARGEPPRDDGLPPAVRAALRTGLAMRPEDRPPTALELVRSMRRAGLGGLPAPSPPGEGAGEATLPPGGAAAVRVAARPRRPRSRPGAHEPPPSDC
ncbi:serine/threonine-protein kinase [Geodermatophilus sp. SYSU D00758]